LKELTPSSNQRNQRSDDLSFCGESAEVISPDQRHRLAHSLASPQTGETRKVETERLITPRFGSVWGENNLKAVTGVSYQAVGYSVAAVFLVGDNNKQLIG
jgi:hypothetical protein